MERLLPISPEHSQEAVRVARAILTGSIGIVDGARKMAAVHLYTGHVRQPRDEDYILFVGIASLSDHLPIGDVRKYWDADALAQKDRELNEFEASYRERALKAAAALVDRFGKDP